MLVLVLLPQPEIPRTMARARHALRTASKQTRSPHWELLRLSPFSWAPEPPPPLTFVSPPCAEPPFAQSLFVLHPSGLAGRSNFCVEEPAGVVSSADSSPCEPGHQATNQPWATVACTLVPSSRSSVTAVTSAPARP